MNSEVQKLSWQVSPRLGSISGLAWVPRAARSLLVLGHGAGADMRHAFMETLAAALAEVHIATLRYQFCYTEGGRRRPDPPAVLAAATRSAWVRGAELGPQLPLWIGGKSMGGRITALVSGDAALPPAAGLIFFGFPLVGAGKGAADRSDVLRATRHKLLLLQGSRDRLAPLSRLTALVSELGPRATLATLPEAGHGFELPKRRGVPPAAVPAWLAACVATWTRGEALPEAP